MPEARPERRAAPNGDFPFTTVKYMSCDDTGDMVDFWCVEPRKGYHGCFTIIGYKKAASLNVELVRNPPPIGECVRIERFADHVKSEATECLALAVRAIEGGEPIQDNRGLVYRQEFGEAFVSKLKSALPD